MMNHCLRSSELGLNGAPLNLSTVTIPHQTLQDLSIQRGSKVLTVHLLSPAESAEHRLLLTESDQKLHAQPLQRLGLTKREAEVLLWICQGKRNCEIAAILGTSERTVGKHVEGILRKLGVETRTAAAIKAFEVLARLGTKEEEISRRIFTQCAGHRTMGL
jgi:DNA-binding CsgD family transcriptional regulator